MKQVGVAALLALALLPLGCARGVQLSQPLAAGQVTDRVQVLTMAISRSPKDPTLYTRRADEYEDRGDYKMALADIDSAIALSPDNQEYRYLRGLVFAYAGNETGAKQEFDRADAMAPGSAESFDAKALLLATDPNAQLRNGKKAIEYATRACQMTSWEDPDMMETLAAAYAETGDFDNAIKWQEKAIDLTSTTLLTTLDERRARLAMYQNHQPWRPAPPLQPLTAS